MMTLLATPFILLGAFIAALIVQIGSQTERDVRVIGISVDSVYSHGAWAAVRGIGFPLLADFNPKGEVARKYHVFRDDLGYSDRALHVIDGDGVIRYSHVAPFLHHIPDIYELFAALDGLKSGAAERAGARP